MANSKSIIIAPIRILHVTGLNLGGSETTLMNYYRHIDRTKIQFDFLITKKGSEKHHYEDEAISFGANIYTRPPRTRHLIRNTLALFRAIRKNTDIEVVHIYDRYAMRPTIDAFVAKLAGIKVRIIYSSNNMDSVRSFTHSFFRPFARLFATHHTACSKEAGISMFGKSSKNKIIVIPRARDLSSFKFDPIRREKMRILLGLQGAKVCIMVARLASQKNHLFILEAFASVVSNIASNTSNVVLLLVGDGPEREAVESKIDVMQLDKHVRVLGARTDIPDLLQVADMLLFPSVYEGFGAVAIEAQASGLPCLLSDTIPRATKVTDLVTFLPINKGPHIWVDAILATMGHTREDTLEQVMQAGNDVYTATKWLTDFYSQAISQRR